MAEVVWRFRIE